MFLEGCAGCPWAEESIPAAALMIGPKTECFDLIGRVASGLNFLNLLFFVTSVLFQAKFYNKEAILKLIRSEIMVFHRGWKGPSV